MQKHRHEPNSAAGDLLLGALSVSLPQASPSSSRTRQPVAFRTCQSHGPERAQDCWPGNLILSISVLTIDAFASLSMLFPSPHFLFSCSFDCAFPRPTVLAYGTHLVLYVDSAGVVAIANSIGSARHQSSLEPESGHNCC